MSEHTKEPWEAVTPCPGECCWSLQQVGNERGVFGHISYPEMREADARRIVACVNACNGIPNNDLTPNLFAGFWKDYRRLEKLLDAEKHRNAELLSALKEMVDQHVNGVLGISPLCLERARTVIVSVKQAATT